MQSGDGRDIGESDKFTNNIGVLGKVLLKDLELVFHLYNGIGLDSLVVRESGSDERKDPAAQRGSDEHVHKLRPLLDACLFGQILAN